jgi:hypothetical protein
METSMSTANAALRGPRPLDEPDAARSQRPLTLRTFALAAAASLVSEPISDTSALELRYLRDRQDAAGDDPWHASLNDYLRRPAAADAPLLYLARELDLTLAEVVAAALATAVEDDVMAGRALAFLQTPIGGSRPTLGLIANLLAPLPGLGSPLDSLSAGAAQHAGLLAFHGEGPLPERAVSVPQAICLALRGVDADWPGVAVGMGELPPVALATSALEQARRHGAALSSAPGRALIIRSTSTVEARAAACAVASALNRQAAFIEGERPGSLTPWLLLRGLVPVFCFSLGPGEHRTLPALPGYRGPVLALCGVDGTVELQGEAALSWRVAVPARAEREALWSTALGDAALARELAADHRHSSGRIAELARGARHVAALDARTTPDQRDLAAAAWIGEGKGLGALAQPIADRVWDDALVAPPNLREELRTLLARCRARDGLTDGLGPAARARYHPGVRALFVGPSGTGKTLGASWLATRLGLPLYRVDLASVTSKYIGETEKNLSELISRAEHAEVVLLFDEADSLFGKRTDVKDSNDRFANAQTNYLLQRIETFDGIAILTSNSRARFDSAFSRRLDAIVEFPLPGPEERRALWVAHLGTEHGLAQRELNQLAAAVDLAGGHIRNAVFSAAATAHANRRAIAYADLVRGVAGEYRKLGRQMPSGLVR